MYNMILLGAKSSRTAVQINMTLSYVGLWWREADYNQKERNFLIFFINSSQGYLHLIFLLFFNRLPGT